MRRLLVVLFACSALIVGASAALAYAGKSQPLMSSYIYDGNLARYFDVDMDELDEAPEVECVVMSTERHPTDMLFRTVIGNWRIIASWPANQTACTVTITHDVPPK